MTRTIRFHLDEQIDITIAEGLRGRRIDVSTTSERNFRGRSDDAHWVLVNEEQRILVTRDSDFLIFHSQGRPHWGIAYCHQQTRSIGQVIQTLELIWELLEPVDMRNRIHVTPSSKKTDVFAQRASKGRVFVICSEAIQSQ